MSNIRYKTPSSNLTNMAAPATVSGVRSSIGIEGGDLYYIRCDRLIPFKNQSRKVFDHEEIEALAKTIREVGVRQPLTVIKGDNDLYEVVSGERRLRAAKEAGLSKVPCILLQNAEKADEIALIENLQRVDLHPIEIAQGYSNLITLRGFSQTDLAQHLSVNKSQVSELMTLNALPENIKRYLLENSISTREILRKVCSLKNENEMLSLLTRSKKSSGERSKQVLKISLSIADEYKIQTDGILKLSQNQRQQLREKLESILETL